MLAQRFVLLFFSPNVKPPGEIHITGEFEAKRSLPAGCDWAFAADLSCGVEEKATADIILFS